jgi:tRNA(Ile)-lysidine synthase
VLLHALSNVRRLKSLHLEVCHVDHGLRPNSASDAAFVAAQCKKLGVDCHVRTLGARPVTENMEAWARRGRYDAFQQLRREQGLHHIVTAHTANDVAETLLMRLIANKELNTIEDSDEERGCLRPLLDITRAQIEEYVVEHSVLFVEDPTNEDTSLVRNRIRKRVIPFIESEFDASIVWSLAERAQALAEDCDALRWMAEQVAGLVGAIEFDAPEWVNRCRTELHSAHPAVQWRVAQTLFTPLLGHTISQGRAEVLLNLLRVENGRVDVGGGRTLEMRKGGLFLSPPEGQKI